MGFSDYERKIYDTLIRRKISPSSSISIGQRKSMKSSWSWAIIAKAGARMAILR